MSSSINNHKLRQRRAKKAKEIANQIKTLICDIDAERSFHHEAIRQLREAFEVTNKAAELLDVVSRTPMSNYRTVEANEAIKNAGRFPEVSHGTQLIPRTRFG